MSSSTTTKFILQFGHFFSGSAANLAIGLISFPILTRLLSKEQYGIMGLITTTMLILVAVSKAGISNGIIRYYELFKDTARQRNLFSSSIFVISLLLSALTAICYFFAIPALSGLFRISSDYARCFELMALYLFIRPINIAIFNMLRVNDKTVMYNVLTTVSRILSTILSLALYFLYSELWLFFVGVILGEFAIGAVLFSWFFRIYSINILTVSRDLARKLALFGVPLLFCELSYLLFSYAARYMIVAINGEAMLGLYTVGYNMATYLSDLLSFPVTYAAVPMFVALYEREGRIATEKFLSQALHYFLIASIAVFFGFLAVSRELFVLLASEKYAAAAAFSPVVLCGTLLLGMNNLLNAGLYVQKKTVTILLIMASSVLLNVVANYFLLPLYDVMGAAMASLGCAVYVTVATVALSYKYLAIRIDRGILFYLVLGVFMFAILNRFDIASVPVALSTKIFAGCLIFITGFLVKEKDLRYRIMNSMIVRKIKVFTRIPE